MQFSERNVSETITTFSIYCFDSINQLYAHKLYEKKRKNNETKNKEST